jgi:hypothetical protein
MDSFMIHVRSKDCLNPTTGFNSRLIVSLKTAIVAPLHHKLHLSLSSAEIPNTWYALSAHLKTNQIHVDGVTNLVIPDGNYDIYELVALINAAPFPYAVVYNENTSKITLTNTDGSSHILNFSEINSRGLGKALGFDREDVLVLAGGFVVGSSVINLNTVHSLFLHSNLAVGNVITTESGNYESILEKIPILGRPLETIHFDPYQTASFTSALSDPSIKQFELSLKDQNGNLVQLNGVRYELSLLVEMVDHTSKSQGQIEYLQNANKRRRDDLAVSAATINSTTATRQIFRPLGAPLGAPASLTSTLPTPTTSLGTPASLRSTLPTATPLLGPPATLPSAFTTFPTPSIGTPATLTSSLSTPSTLATPVPVLAPPATPAPRTDLSSAMLMAKLLDIKD